MELHIFLPKWSKINFNRKVALFDIAQFNDSKGVIVGWGGAIYLTENGGFSWKELPKFTDKYLKGVSLTNSGNGLIVGAGGSIFRTNDFGKSWIEIKTEVKFGLTDVKFINKNIALIIGNRGTLLYSDNAGFDWKLIKTKKIQNFNSLVLDHYNKITYITGNKGVLLKLKE